MKKPQECSSRWESVEGLLGRFCAPESGARETLGMYESMDGEYIFRSNILRMETADAFLMQNVGLYPSPRLKKMSYPFQSWWVEFSGNTI